MVKRFHLLGIAVGTTLQRGDRQFPLAEVGGSLAKHNPVRGHSDPAAKGYSPLLLADASRLFLLRRSESEDVGVNLNQRRTYSHWPWIFLEWIRELAEWASFRLPAWCDLSCSRWADICVCFL